jgi:hypothetical protein
MENKTDAPQNANASQCSSDKILAIMESLNLLARRTRLFRYKFRIDLIMLIVFLLILCILKIKLDISDFKYILILFIGTSSTCISLRMFLLNYNREISLEASIIKNSVDSEIYVDFRELHTSTLPNATTEDEFVNVISDRYSSYKERLIFSCILAIFPTMIGVTNYIASVIN